MDDSTPQRIFHFRLFLPLLILPLCLVRPGGAQTIAGAPAVYLGDGADSRAGGMGNAHVAIAAGAGALAWNPAGVTGYDHLRIIISQRRLAYQRQLTHLAFALPLTGNLSLGAGWLRLNAGGLEARSANTREPDAYFSDREDAFSAIVAMQVGSWLKLGLGVRILQQRLFEHSAVGRSLMAGLMVAPAEHVKIGLAWHDFASRFRWRESDSITLPQRLMIGIGWQASPMMLIAVDYHQSSWEWQGDNLSSGRLQAGIELKVYDDLPLRLGLTPEALSAGFGFRTDLGGTEIGFDYAYTAQGGINTENHAISLSINFGSAPQPGLESAAPPQSRPAAFVPDAAASPPSSKSSWIVITTQALNVRQGPGTQYARLEVVFEGARYRVVQENGRWLQIVLNSGKKGWVHRGYVHEEASPK